MERCVNCGSQMIYPSKTRTRWEKLRKQVTAKRPFRCHCCEWRGWGIELGPKYGSDDIALASQLFSPQSPDLETVEGPTSADPNYADPVLTSLDK
jgi:hypothetical protein